MKQELMGRPGDFSPEFPQGHPGLSVPFECWHQDNSQLIETQDSIRQQPRRGKTAKAQGIDGGHQILVPSGERTLAGPCD